jgi:hypothetical protein
MAIERNKKKLGIIRYSNCFICVYFVIGAMSFSLRCLLSSFNLGIVVKWHAKTFLAQAELTMMM